MGSGFMYGMNLQNGISPVMRDMSMFHDKKMVILMIMASLVGGTLLLLWSVGFSSLDFMDKKVLEVVWTCMPVFVLMTLALPSLELLYYMDSPSSTPPFTTLKVMGRQWYWSYELSKSSEKEPFIFDSYMLSEKDPDFSVAGFRLLEVDNPVFLPRGEYIRILVTGGDVMHSFCIPSLGMKVDAVPGRLNQTYIFPMMLGSFYGQCSEMCGANHSFMPINVEIIPSKVFVNI